MGKNKVLEKNSHKKYYCEHGKRKYICSICGGSQISRKSSCKDCGGGDYCKRNRQKIFCIVCGGSQICSHNKQKSQCKKCSDPIKVIIHNWMSSLRQNDRFIDKCFLKRLIKDYPCVITKTVKPLSSTQNIKTI